VKVWLAIAWITLAAATPAGAQTITDGDTLKLNGTVYRLWGIDAPETKQDCPDGWPAGRLATTKLLAFIQGRTVVCEAKDTDRYGRTIAVCRAGSEDIGAAMVRTGFAWAFIRYSSDYASQEARAKADRLGVHAHNCLPAWEWRARAKGDK
jgi:endonuclease YncB( thermonuclease family)